MYGVENSDSEEEVGLERNYIKPKQKSSVKVALDLIKIVLKIFDQMGSVLCLTWKYKSTLN